MLKDYPEISVILPFYNSEKTLLRALQSISAQSFQNFECLLINNNSADKSSIPAINYTQTDPRFFYYEEPLQGVVHASNYGTLLSRGKYICRMDADDELTKNSLLLRKQYLDRNPGCDVVAGIVQYISFKTGKSGFQRYVRWSNSLKTYKEISLNRFVESPLVNPSVMWRKEISLTFGMYRAGHFPEDYELWLRWLEKGVVFNKINESVLKWYDSETRLTRIDPSYSDEAFFYIKSHYLKSWLKKYNPHHPDVIIWGASRLSRKWSQPLIEEGINIIAYIDIHLKRRLESKLIHYKNIPGPGKSFILVYIRHLKQKKEIKTYLQVRGYIEGKDFLFCA